MESLVRFCWNGVQNYFGRYFWSFEISSRKGVYFFVEVSLNDENWCVAYGIFTFYTPQREVQVQNYEQVVIVKLWQSYQDVDREEERCSLVIMVKFKNVFYYTFQKVLLWKPHHIDEISSLFSPLEYRRARKWRTGFEADRAVMSPNITYALECAQSLAQGKTMWKSVLMQYLDNKWL